jgi:hypothetical protein
VVQEEFGISEVGSGGFGGVIPVKTDKISSHFPQINYTKSM